MSHIPSSAMPHAAPKSAQESPPAGSTETPGRFGRLGDIGSGIADTVRAHPRAAAAAGAAVAAGVVAAAAIPAMRARSRSGGGSSS